MKQNNFFKSVKTAFIGLARGIRTEHNFLIYFIHVFLTLPINFLVGFALVEHLIYFAIVCGVFSAEYFNTVAEKLCDFLTQHYDPKIGYIKDLAAGGVLCWGIAFYVSEIIMVVSHLVK